MKTAKMKHKLQAYYDFFGQPLGMHARVLLFVSIFAVFWAFRGPLWTMSFTSNQYPDPLRMAIHINRLEGQKTAMRDDLREINGLNHYIGMRPILESDFSEFSWLPFAVGGFVLLCLRCVALGRLRDLVDVVVLYIYFGLFSLWDFYTKLYNYGHNLAPDAAITVPGFTPPLYGTKKIANFWIESYPGVASFALAAFGALLTMALIVGILNAIAEQRRQLREVAASV
jgi:copper chaperone NosL